MARQKISYTFIAIFTIILLVIVYLHTNFRSDHNSSEFPSKPYSQSEDTLRVLLYAHSSDYFMFRSTPIGFQYELLNNLAKSLNKKLDLTVNGNPDEVFSMAFSNQYDIVAMDFQKDPITSQLLTLSIPHSQSYAVLIERVPEKNDTINDFNLYIPAQFPAKISTDSLDNSDWKIAYSSGMTIEDLFDLLQNKKVSHIVSDYQTAITLLPFYPDLQIVKTLGEKFDRTWVLNDHNDTLNKQVNKWLDEYKKSKSYASLCKKYFSPYSHLLSYTSPKKQSRRISPYDHLLKRYAKKQGLDWRFVASIIYEESKFQSNLIGMGGSFGLMQMMPGTGARYGISHDSTPEEQIRAGVTFISQLKRRYKDHVENEDDLLHFICAAYNAGAGHIQDAQRLCEKFGEDKYVWSNVAKYLELKSESQYYNDPVVKLGYYPGRHTVKYAERVISRYNGYKTIVK